MQIIDDFLPADQYQFLADLVRSIDFDWHWEAHAASQPEHSAVSGTRGGWVHLLGNRSHNVRSWALDHFAPLLDQLVEHTGLTVGRARVTALQSRWGSSPDDYLTPHVDYMCAHTTAIYYLDSSDGDTVFFEQVFGGYPQPQLFTVSSRVSPRANRLVLFDGLQYHTATAPCTSELRVVVNVNLF